MSASIAVAPDGMPRPRALWPRVARGIARGVAAAAVVAAFWYGATGALLALERSATTRLLALAVATGAAVAGIALTRAAGRVSGAAAATRAVFGGALLWTCVSAAFYSGWVVGPTASASAASAAAGAHGPTMARALAAIAATAYSSVLAAALLALAVWVAHRPGQHSDAGRFSALTFATLWAAHELAKLNVFAGVASPGADYLPAYLAHLRQFFGPPTNSPLLAWSVAVLAAIAVAFAWRAARATDDAERRTGYALLAGIVALAAFEHAMLGERAPLDWWKPFLAWRGLVGG